MERKYFIYDFKEKIRQRSSNALRNSLTVVERANKHSKCLIILGGHIATFNRSAHSHHHRYVQSVIHSPPCRV